MKIFIVETLQARAKTGELIACEGINDHYTPVQMIIPIEYFSTTEQISFGAKSVGYPFEYLEDKGTGNINLGEHEAKDYYDKFDLFTIEIKTIEVK